MSVRVSMIKLLLVAMLLLGVDCDKKAYGKENLVGNADVKEIKLKYLFKRCDTKMKCNKGEVEIPLLIVTRAAGLRICCNTPISRAKVLHYIKNAIFH